MMKISSSKKEEKKAVGRLCVFSFLLGLVFLIAAGTFFVFKGNFSNYVFQRGAYYFNGGEYDIEKAEKFYKIAKVLEGENYLADYQLARIHFVQNKLDLAKTEIDSAIAKNPENKRSFYIRGLIDGYAKNYGEAQEDFKKFVEWAPEEWAGYNDLAWVYFEDGKFQEAAEAAENGLKGDLDNPWLLNGAGVAYQAMGEFQKAEEYLGKVKEIAANMSVEDWGRAYPGNSPENYPWELAKFKSDVGTNLILALSQSDQKGSFQSACASSSVGQCSGDRCVQVGCVTCDSDADRALGNCCDSYSNVCSGNWQCDSSCKCTGTDKCGKSVTIPCSLSGRNPGEFFCGSAPLGDREFFCRATSGGTLVQTTRRCTLDCCTPNCGCAANTCLGSTCSDGCGGLCNGTRSCVFPTNGDCGTAINSPYAIGAPFPGSFSLCSAGSLVPVGPILPNVSGASVLWSCRGLNGGTSENCRASRVIVPPPPTCPNGVCGIGEDCSNCPVDCGVCPPPPTCPNGVCGIGEDCNNCPADCGACPPPPPPTCPNGVCGAGEDCSNCPADCGICPPPPTCPNGTCGAGEDCNNCPADCGACPVPCPDGVCGAGEDCNTCQADCGLCGTEDPWREINPR